MQNWRFCFSTKYVLCFNAKQQRDYTVVSLTNCSNQKETRTYLNLHKHHSIPHSMTQLWMVGMSKRTNMFAQCSSLVSWTMEFCVVGTNLNATLDNVEFQTWHDQFIVCEIVVVLYIASSTAEGGGGSFKNRKPLGEVGCCEWRIAEQNPLMDRRVVGAVFLGVVAMFAAVTSPQLVDVAWCSAVVAVVVVVV